MVNDYLPKCWVHVSVCDIRHNSTGECVVRTSVQCISEEPEESDSLMMPSVVFFFMLVGIWSEDAVDPLCLFLLDGCTGFVVVVD